MRLPSLLLLLPLIACSSHEAKEADTNGIAYFRQWETSKMTAGNSSNEDIIRKVTSHGKSSQELYQQAISSFTEAIRLDPKNAQYHYHLGLALAHGNYWDHAALELEIALRLKPDHLDASKTLTIVRSNINR